MEKKKKVLVADDEPQLQSLFELFLVSLGYQVDVVGDGEAAIEYLKSNDTDLIILDYHLPKRTGIEVLEKLNEADFLKQHSNHQNTKVIFVTGSMESKVKEEAINSGAAGFMLKPFTLESLERLLEEALDSKAA